MSPSLSEPVAAWLDTQLWSVLEAATGLNIPRGDRGQAGDFVVDVPVHGLGGKSYQHWVTRLPVRLYGWGFRSLEETCCPAYLGTLETALPRMSHICPIMTGTWGGPECWRQGAATQTRWSVMLGSGCKERVEMSVEA